MDELNRINSLRCYSDDSLYPEELRSIKNAPSVIYYNGELSIINDLPCVAIVGAREASHRALQFAYKLGKMAAECGFAVVNGLAIGCDTEALRGALSVNGKCVAVMPCGVDCIYPKINRSLADSIISSGGCVISEYPDGVRPQKQYFIKRDRIQSGLSQGVIVVEAKEHSGTMHTVKFAQKQNKRLAAYYSKLLEVHSGNRMIVENNEGCPIDDDKSIHDFLLSVRRDRNETGRQLVLELIQ